MKTRTHKQQRLLIFAEGSLLFCMLHDLQLLVQTLLFAHCVPVLPGLVLGISLFPEVQALLVSGHDVTHVHCCRQMLKFHRQDVVTYLLHGWWWAVLRRVPSSQWVKILLAGKSTSQGLRATILESWVFNSTRTCFSLPLSILHHISLFLILFITWPLFLKFA